jgi:hypothetical protein
MSLAISSTPVDAIHPEISAVLFADCPSAQSRITAKFKRQFIARFFVAAWPYRYTFGRGECLRISNGLSRFDLHANRCHGQQKRSLGVYRAPRDVDASQFQKQR